jgi:hypothetical protein
MFKFLLKLIICFFICLLLSIDNVYPCEYTKEEICSAIWIIEGGEKASQHYGINPKYIKCDTKKECQRICFNTVENNKIRFKNQTKEKDYLTFLAKRYCPPNWKTWLKNLKFYLEKNNESRSDS